MEKRKKNRLIFNSRLEWIIFLIVRINHKKMIGPQEENSLQRHKGCFIFNEWIFCRGHKLVTRL